MTVATARVLGRPLWYELMTTDMKGAEAFYRTVVGWKTGGDRVVNAMDPQGAAFGLHARKA